MSMVRLLSDAELSTFGGQVCDRRQAKHVSLAELTRRAEVSKSNLWEIEQNRVEPGVHLAARIAHALETTVDDLLTGGRLMHGVEIGA